LKAANPTKILLIRFSSFGDVLQTLSVVAALKTRWPTAEIHWVTRSEFVPLLKEHPGLTKVWSLDKRQGFRGLLELSRELRAERFRRIYDAHNNLRSLFLSLALFWGALAKGQPPPRILRRSIRRWKRFLLFRLRLNFFEQPFSGQRDLLEPLQAWGIAKQPPPAPQLFLPAPAHDKVRALLEPQQPFIALAPSAAYALKRWPVEHWKSLLQLWLAQNPKMHFVLLGGPEDHFIEEFVNIEPLRIHNFSGRLSLEESAAVVAASEMLVANDTGLLHVGEQLGHPTIALMGPAPFGFPCRRHSTTIMELTLDCRPCSKHGQGPCRNTRFQWCLAGISPEMVLSEALLKLQFRVESKL
jgi:ADP-heptose:LPS heptosyltransferase